MKTMSRLHVYAHKKPHDRAYIVGERKSLRALAKKLEMAADGAVGLEKLKIFSSDGHEYELMIVTDITEEEWQNLNPPYEKSSDPSALESVKVYDSIQAELQ